MKIVVLYRPDSEYARIVEEFVRDYKLQHNAGRLELINIDSRDGSALASLYDVMQHPAILALRDDGSLLRSWIGPLLPLMTDVAAYTYS